ncbi:hypothetical protein ABK040_002529 [Willaertia magna]
MSLWKTFCCYLFFISYLLHYGQTVAETSKSSKLFIQNDESLFAMGTYTKGEMGIDLTNTPHVPYPLDFSGFNFTVKEIIIGSYMNAFLTKNGELYSIGNNDYGKFGDGITAGAFVNTVPSRFNISKPIVKAATGTCHMLVLTVDGEVFGSGCNFYNVLSAETSISFPSPILIFNSSYNIIDIETNWYLTIAISSTGEIYTLGENNGHPETGNNLLAKVTQGLEGKFIKRVVGSSTYSIVETFTKEFYIFGKLSANTFVKPTLIESLSGSNWMNFTDIKTTSNSFLCLTNASTVYSVSYGGQGFVLNFVRNKVKVIVHDRLLTSDNILMLRDSSTEQYLSLKHLRPNTEIVKMLKDPKHNNPITYYYANDGTFYFSINYESGNINGNAGNNFGFSPLNITSSYVNINPFNLNYVKPSKGSAYTVFLNSVDNTIFTTGVNVNGALGDGTTKDTLSPITFYMDLLKDKEIIDISVGHYHTLILTKDREVYAFGSNLRKQFCQSTYATANQLMKLSLSNVVAISAGLDFSLFVIATPEGNRVYACGYSTNGETGIGATQDLANSYIDFFNNTNITSVVGANGYSFFLAGNGTAYALGGNLYNRFGNNDFNYQIYTSPVQITGINDKIVKISSANEISLFLTDKGEVYYTKTNVKNTVKLDGLVGEQIVDIGTGSNYGLMLTNNGKLFGLFSGDFNSYFGQLGMLNPGKYSLQRIPLFHKVKRMEVGLYHSFLAVSKVETFCEGLSNCSYNGKSEGTEKISTFSFTINVKNNTVDTSQIIYNYFIENIFNQTTNSSTIDFTMKSKGSYNLIVTLFVKERQDFIYGKQFKTITVNELKEDTITNLNINDIYEITKNNDIYNNENKSTIINQIVTTTQKEIVQTKDQGDKILDIYKSVVKTNNDIPISVNITLQVNQISNLYLTMKQNDNITDTQIDSSVQSIVLILDNILQQTNSSSNITNISKDDLKRDTENTLQTTFSLLSLSKSIEEKRIEGNAINLVFKRRTTTTNGNTNLNITTEYQFNIPTDLNLETSNNDISFGAIKIGDSQLYQTNNEMNSLSNVIQLKTFVNGSYTPLKNLKQSIIISFKLESKGINSFNSTTSYSCRYFNDNSKQWLSDGCKPVGAVTLNNGIIVMNCECDHTTSFLTFLKSNSKSNNTSIAQLVLSSIYLLIIILIFILLIIFRKDPIVKSRYITPFIGLTAIFIDSLFSGIIANAIFQQTKIFNTLSSITITTSNASDIVGNVAIIISSMMTLIAIACYFIESFRYLIIRYLYEILNNNLKDNNDTNQLLNSNIEKKPLLKILSSKLIYVISALVISISIIIYYVIFVILRRFNVISSTAFTSVTSIAFFVLIILFSLAIISIYIIDIYFTMKYKQFSNEMIDLIKIMESDEQNSSTSSISTTVANSKTSTKKNKKEMINNYQNNLINFFYYNDSLLFRSEACIYFIGLIFFIISFGIGFYLLSKEQLKEQQQLSEVILAFDLIRTISWIMLFGGYITMIILIKKLKNLVFKRKTNRADKSENENNNYEEFNFSFILKKREVFKLFKQFAKQEFSLENIYAFIDLENLKELNKQDTNNNNNIWEEAEKFKSKYLITNATMELNVSFELKKQVNNYLNERKEMNNLIECIETALSINLGDTYSRFIETDEYQIIDKCNEMKEKLIHN